MNVRKVLARLNTPSFAMPTGRPPAGKESVASNCRISVATRRQVGGTITVGGKERPALEVIDGVQSLTRVSGSQTRSFNLDRLTPIDIAHAVGKMRDSLARDLFCAMWWADSTASVWPGVRRRLLAELWEEVGKRRHAVIDAELALELRRSEGSPTHREQDRLATARAAAWPVEGERYSRLVDAAFANLDNVRICTQCRGEKVALVGVKLEPCSACGGSGQIAVSTAAIAEAIGVSEMPFRKYRPVYEWVHERMRGLERAAAEELRGLLGE